MTLPIIYTLKGTRIDQLEIFNNALIKKISTNPNQSKIVTFRYLNSSDKASGVKKSKKDTHLKILVKYLTVSRVISVNYKKQLYIRILINDDPVVTEKLNKLKEKNPCSSFYIKLTELGYFKGSLKVFKYVPSLKLSSPNIASNYSPEILLSELIKDNFTGRLGKARIAENCNGVFLDEKPRARSDQI